MQVLREQDNQASITDAKEVDKQSLLFFVHFRFLHSAFVNARGQHLPREKLIA